MKRPQIEIVQVNLFRKERNHFHEFHRSRHLWPFPRNKKPLFESIWLTSALVGFSAGAQVYMEMYLIYIQMTCFLSLLFNFQNHLNMCLDMRH